MRSRWRVCEPAFSVYEAAQRVRECLQPHGGEPSAADDEEVLRFCERQVLKDTETQAFSPQRRETLARLVFCALRCELEVLQDMAEDPGVTEIMVNGPDCVFWERDGIIARADVSFESEERLYQVIQRLAGSMGREWNELHPIVDARLSDGSRVNAVHGSIALDGPVLTIRKFNRSRMTMDDLVRQGDISEEGADMLQTMVRAGCNVFVSGGTSTGKTTFLNILSEFIPRQERVILIEDSAELQIRGIPNLVRMETRGANAQGKGGVSMRDLIRTSLRMRPDRVIVGEVRGEEVVDMLAAMSTGHDGSLSTGHANSVRGMIGRLETMHISSSGFPLEAVREQIAQAIDVYVHLYRTAGGRRLVAEITESAGMRGGQIALNPLFVRNAAGDLVSTGNALAGAAKDKLERPADKEGEET
ncbi:MAG: Flp pilus assembly complex ATPase component TadA [Clostridia bacterium]|nr:Flp pilus assembly complex ATPase component TadA [Clostridia bacterium]